MIVSNPLGRQLLRTLGLFLVSLYLSTSFVAAQSCSAACAALDISYSISNADQCIITFTAEQAGDTPVGYESDVQWTWSLDGIESATSNAMTLSYEATQSSEVVTLEAGLTPIGTEAPCVCSLDIDLDVALFDFNWPCSCLPGDGPVADFDFTGLGQCGGVLSFENASAGAGLDYAWTFGEDGNYGVSSEFNPIVTFNIPGGGVSQVPVTLSVVDENGCTDTWTEEIPVLQTPDPWFVEAEPICTNNESWPIPFSLLNSNSNYFEDNGLTQLTIDWGNGDVDVLTAMEVPFTTEYFGYGTYTISFTALGTNGCASVAQDQLFVGSNPEIETASPGMTAGLCAPELLVFPLTSYENNDPATVYTVDFGDGTAATFNHPPPSTVEHIYASSSCGASGEFPANAFHFSIEASNECLTTATNAIFIEVLEVVPPPLSGPATVCVGSTGDYQVFGGFQSFTETGCELSSLSGNWEVIALQGQTPPVLNMASGSEFEPTFTEPGLYQIDYVDDALIQAAAPCEYDATASLEVCVMASVEPEWSWESTSVCIPMEVQLSNDTPEPPCGESIFSWTVQGGAYEWAIGSGANDENPELIFLEAANYTVSLSVASGLNGVCGAASSQAILASTAAPEVFINAASDSLCVGATWNGQVLINPGNTVLTDFGWTLDGLEVGPTSPGPLPQVIETVGLHTVEVSASNSCGTAVQQYAVFAAPIPEITFNAPYASCNGFPVEITASGGNSYFWSATEQALDDGFDSDSSVTYIMNGYLLGSVVGTQAYGSFSCSSTENFSVNASPVPSLEIVGESMICDGGTLDLNASVSLWGSYFVNWIGHDTAVEGNEFTLSIDPGEEGPFEIEAIVTSYGGGCTDTASWTVHVQQLPEVEAGAAIEVCNQSIEVLLDSGFPAGGTWTGPGVVSPEGLFNPEFLEVGDSSLTYTYADAFGCASEDTLNVAVGSPQAINVVSDSTVCESEEMIGLGSLASPEGGTWSGEGVFGALSDSLNISVLSAGSYNLVYALGEGTCYVTDTLELTILESPQLWVHPIGGLPCMGDSLEIEALTVGGAGGGYAYNWSTNVDVSSTDSSHAFLSVEAITEIVLTVTDNMGCSVTDELIILPFPQPIILMPENFEECMQDIEVSLPEVNPIGGLWSGPGVVESATGMFNPSLVGLGTTMLNYSATNVFGCSQTDSVQVELIEVELAEAGEDMFVCETEGVITLEGASPAGGTWSGPGVIDSIAGLVDVAQLSFGTTILTYSTGSGSCLHSDNRIVHVVGNPEVVIVSSEADNLACAGDSVIWTAQALGGNVSSSSDYQFDWTGSATPDLDNPAQAWWIAISPETIVQVLVTDTLGCQVEIAQSIAVESLPILELPQNIQECAQSIEVLLPAAIPLGGMWSGPGVVDASLGLFNPGSFEAGFWELTYSYTNASGCSANAGTTIEIIEPETVVAGDDLAICASDEVIQLGGFSPAIGGTWSGTGVLDTSTGSVDIAELTPATYALVYQTGLGSCAVEDTLSLTILEVPEVNGISAATTCLNSALDVSLEVTGGEAPYLVNWLTAVDSVSEDGMSASVLAGDSGEAWLEAELSDLNGCMASVSWTFEVLELPVVYAGPDRVFCDQPVLTQLTGNSPEILEGGQGSFYGLGAALLAVSADGVFDPSVASAGTFEVVYAFENAATTCTQTDTLIVIVNTPDAFTAGPDTVVCANATLVQFEGFDSSLDVVWSGQTDAANAALVDAVNGVVNPQLLSVGIHVFQASTGVETCLVTDERSIEIQPLPVIEIASDESFCASMGLVELSGPAPNGGLWIGEGVEDPLLGMFDTDQTPGPFELAYTFTDALTGCSDTVPHQVVIQPLPIAQIEAADVACNTVPWAAASSSIDASETTWIVNGSPVEDDALEILLTDAGWSIVQLFVANEWGCVDSTLMEVEVVSAPVALMEPSVLSGCAPLDVAFENQSTASRASYAWSINGQLYADTVPPLQTFQQGDDVVNYGALLTVTNACGSSQDSSEIAVLPHPQMAIAMSEDSVCSPYTAEFINASVGNPEVLNWDFGNGQLGSGWNPEWPTYSVNDLPVAYDVSLFGSNACGIDTATTVIWVEPNSTVAMFDLSAVSGCAPMELTVTDLSVDATQMTFDFGNGQVSSDSTATALFEDEGSYLVTQYISNGCSYDTASVVIEVVDAPDFQWVVDATTLCAGEIGVFGIESNDMGSVQWSFGDDNTATGPEATHAWEATGTHWVYVELGTALMACSHVDSLEMTVHPTPELEVTASDLEGCSPLTVAFTNTTVDAAVWLWDFADSSASSDVASPDHMFTNEGLDVVHFDVLVEGESSESCVASEVIQITVLPLPLVEFALDANSACGNPAQVQTLNSSQEAINFAWSLDGNIGSSMFAPNLEVAGVGVHTIQLAASNAYGCESMMEQTFEVYANPLPALAVDPDAGCQPLMLWLNDQSTGAVTSTLHIDLDGLTVYSGQVPTEEIALTEVGVHTLTLEVVSSEGCVQTMAIPQTVEVWPTPDVDFSTDPYAGTASEPHPLNSTWNFENETETGTASFWEFGDGASSSQWNASHSYDVAGTYPVTLTVYNEFGCFQELTQSVEILENLQVFIPNAFTPPSGGYSDGVNDGWRPEVSDVSLIDQYDLKVFNRWGQLVWQTQDPEAYWLGSAQPNGSYFAGDDVYTWVLQIKSNTLVGFSREWKGHVTLFR